MDDPSFEPPRVLGLPPIEYVGLSGPVVLAIRDRFSTTYDLVLQDLQKKGLPVDIQRPAHSFPVTGVSHLESQGAAAYGSAWDENVAWLSYVNHHLTVCLSLLLAADNTLDVTARTLHRKFVEENKALPPPSRKSLEDIKNLVVTNPHYQDALRTQQQYAQQRKMLEGYIDTLQRNLTAISRHITVRGQDLWANGGGGQRGGWSPEGKMGKTKQRPSWDDEDGQPRLPPGYGSGDGTPR